MIENIRSKLIKTRKQHKCFGCGDVIQSNSDNILCYTIVSDGEIYNTYMCQHCQKYYNENCKTCKNTCFDGEGYAENYIYDCEKKFDEVNNKKIDLFFI